MHHALADLCGLEAPDYLDGTTLRPVLNDPTKSVKDAAFTQLRRGNLEGYSIRTAQHRYTLWDEGRRGHQLYDMQADPDEANNLADDPTHEETVAQLRERLREYGQTSPLRK